MLLASIRSVVVFGLVLAMSVVAKADDPSTKSLLDVQADGVERRWTPSTGSAEQVNAARSDDKTAPGIIITIQPGKSDYPGIELKPDGANTWDLSAFGHIEVRVTNTGTAKLNLNVRVDNAGDWKDSPWNSEQASFKPGETKSVTMIFGYSFGHKPSYALKSAEVTQVLFFTGKSKVPQSFRVESVIASGPAGEKPPVDPQSIRIKPKGGVILGAGMPSEVALRMTGSKGAEGGVRDQTAWVRFPTTKPGVVEQAVLQPVAGKWDLREANEVHVRLKNDGAAAITPSVQVLGKGVSTDLITAAGPIAPGGQAEIIVPFIPASPWKGISNVSDRTSWEGEKGTGTKFNSDMAEGIKLSATPDGETTLTIESITAVAGIAKLPEWLGTRPPVEGQWAKTFDDEFDGSTIDSSKWNVYGENYWDKKSHFSKDNVIVGGGVVKLRFEKKTGHQNDDPNHKRETDYATGFLESLGKWTQRYGYFETRIKVPTAPGLWPAFWLMPDRGAAAGPQWKRQDTAHGAMEFDVFEQLSRWGPFRTNIAMHWDGYQKTHKQTGTQNIYFQTDKDGFVTVGLLWTPGLAVYYYNGNEVARWECDRISNVPADLMFTLPMGGWDNNALDDKTLPDEFVIDYVRCWQRDDLAALAPWTVPATQPTAVPAK
ncbi:hypothetical protein BH10PLA1_BH10PLA1_00960 [soil metagenome]